MGSAVARGLRLCCDSWDLELSKARKSHNSVETPNTMNNLFLKIAHFPNKQRKRTVKAKLSTKPEKTKLRQVERRATFLSESPNH